MRKRFFLVVLVTAVLLAGCSNGPDLSRVHRNMEAEYMAGLLLKYDEDNEEMLDYDRSILFATPTPEPEETPAAKETAAPDGDNTEPGQDNPQTGGDEDQPATYISMNELGKVQGITLSQQSYELKKSYGSDYAFVSASSGKKLLVVKFRLKNGDSSAKKVNMASADMSYSLELGGERVAGAPMMTLLPNDLQSYRENIPAGKSREAVLIFEIDQSQKVTDGCVYVSDGRKTARAPLK